MENAVIPIIIKKDYFSFKLFISQIKNKDISNATLWYYIINPAKFFNDI